MARQPSSGFRSRKLTADDEKMPKKDNAETAPPSSTEPTADTFMLSEVNMSALTLSEPTDTHATSSGANESQSTQANKAEQAARYEEMLRQVPIVPWSREALGLRTQSTDATVGGSSSSSPSTAKKTKRSKRKAAKNPAEKPHFPLLKVPNEVLVKILEYTLLHPKPIPVDAKWNHLPTYHDCMYPALDYRILHACKRTYVAGINSYFRNNTFAIDLTLFTTQPDYFCGPLDDPKTDSWPYGTGHEIQAQEVHSVVVTSKTYNYFMDAPRFLRGFENLTYVAFDLRVGDQELDWEDLSKADAGEEVRELLLRGGVQLAKDAKIQTLDRYAPEAERKAVEWLLLDLEKGVEAWENGSRRPYFGKKMR